MRFQIAWRTPPDPRSRPKTEQNPEWVTLLLASVLGVTLVEHNARRTVVKCHPEVEGPIRQHLGQAFFVGVLFEDVPLLDAYMDSLGLTLDEYYSQMEATWTG